ncbi:MAG: DUF721 domain-containing protein [Desulfobacterales bacterium]|nr:DUF721 domain-containing protein [Desulfobacterales bacterium]
MKNEINEIREKKGFVHIGQIIHNILTNTTIKNAPVLVQIWEVWSNAVGKNISDNAKPAAFKGNTLLVYVSSSVWLNEIQFLKKDLIQKVNLSLGDNILEDIKFKIGPV